MLKMLKINEIADKLGRVKHIIKQTLLKVPGDDWQDTVYSSHYSEMLLYICLFVCKVFMSV